MNLRQWERMYERYDKRSEKYRRARLFLIRRMASIKSRCENPNASGYSYYGGRGIEFRITYGELWKLWERDKGWKLKRPSIDRIDNEGHYTFENCQFIELVANARKKSSDRTKRNLDNFLRTVCGSAYKEQEKFAELVA